MDRCTATRLLNITVLALVTGFLAGAPAFGQDAHPVTGREIAPVMGVLGAPWLDRPERMAEERPDLAVKLLRLKEGMAVADIGAGSGYFTERLARAVGPTGKVYATDVQPGMLRLLEIRKKQKKLANVQVVQGTLHGTGLAAASIDLALMVDVYHEFGEPQAMLKDLRRALKPGGRIALVEYRKEDPDVPILEEHKMSEKQAILELTAAGFRHLKTEHALPRQHLILFEKPDQQASSNDPIQ
jgi:ubiquinone/menaquinone biosynthesis C-methylase UbiE